MGKILVSVIGIVLVSYSQASWPMFKIKADCCATPAAACKPLPDICKACTNCKYCNFCKGNKKRCSVCAKDRIYGVE